MKPALASHRLRAQQLIGDGGTSPAEIVGHLGAVQSQLHDMALWAIGRRCGATLAEVEAAFAHGDFLRTHVLRPTWHDVLPVDLRDLLELTAPRIRQAMASNNRRDGLERDVIERWACLAIDAVKEHGPLTRADVEQHLNDAGFVRAGNSLAHVMIEAELTGAVHSGPPRETTPRGKQQTYVAADLPSSRRSPDERLAWIARLYGRGHGPFRDKDLAWWTSLTLTQSRRCIALAELEPIELAGETYFRDADDDSVDDVPRALLLSNFDEFISYARDPDDYARLGGRDWGMLMRATGLLFVDGALAGSWTRSITATKVSIQVAPSAPVARAVHAAIEAEAERFATFVDRPLTLAMQALR